MNYKHLGRRSMQAALRQGEIATEQYSRPQRKSIDHALNRRLVMDHQLYRRQPYAMASCDLKSCYDRINHTAASLSLQSIGISQGEIRSMFTTIQQMIHKVRTAFGDSTQTYGGHQRCNRWKLPPQGVLQGNGSGPSIWSIISSKIFHILRDKGYRNKFISSLRKLLIDLAGFAYVDDTDLLQIDNYVELVVQYMQQKLTTWNELVSVTGGILAPTKCWWYLITFKFKKGKWIACDAPENHQLTINDEKEVPVLIKRIPVSQGTNMLGVHMAPDGSNLAHIHALRKKAETWATNMTGCHSNREEVWTALHRTIPFAIGYSLPAVTLTNDHCRYIMAPVYKCGLPRAGISATIPTPIRHGPHSMMGLSLMDPYIQMGVSQVEKVVSNTWLKDPTGVFIDIALDDLALEMGIIPLQPSLDETKLGLRYCTSTTWIKHVMHFMIENDIHIDFAQKNNITNPRERDSTIMSKAISYTNHVPTLQAINRVRMSLHVLWISDISTADGRKLDPQWKVRSRSYPKRNTYIWPLRHHTTSADWSRWNRFLSWLCPTIPLSLGTSLGSWTLKRPDWCQTWDCFLTPNKEFLYIRMIDAEGWKRHLRQDGRRGRMQRYHNEYLLLNNLPEQSHLLTRASIHTYRTYIEVHSTGNYEDIGTHIPEAEVLLTFHESRTQILHAISTVLQPDFLYASDSIDLLIRDFSRGTLVAVSDGSYYPDLKRAAGAWLLESECRTQWIMCSMTVPGPADDFNSYRSELMGLLGISATIRLLASGRAEPRHCIVGCDGEAALKTLLLPREYINSNLSNSDLISKTHELWSSLTVKPLPTHIEGHKDASGKALTRLEKMNVMMDKLATLTATSCPPRKDRVTLPGIGLYYISQGSHSISGNLTKALYKNITSKSLFTYMNSQVFPQPQRYEDICWGAIKYARERTSININIFISKWVSNTIATGVVMQRRKQRIFNRCPRCNHWGEDRKHVLICWDTRAKVIWETQLKKLHAALINEDTHPDIIEFIVKGLTAFRLQKEETIQHMNIDWKMDQMQITMFNLMIGFISQRMVYHQQQYYKEIGSRKGGTQWAGKLILKTWNIVHGMWLGRNDVLHQKDIINSLSGDALLDIAVEQEYDLGYADLPPIMHKWFRKPKEQLLNESVEYKKGWLLLVKSVKESLQIADYNIFSSSTTLRRWIGLQTDR